MKGKKKRGVLEFSTPDADYILNLNPWREEIAVENLENVDAIIVETGPYEYNIWDLENLIYSEDHGNLVRENLKLDEPRPIFFVDLPIRKTVDKETYAEMYILSTLGPSMLSFISPYFSPLVLPFVSFVSFPLNSKSNTLAKINGYLSLSRCYTPSGLRSAVSAKKVEENIVPEMKGRINEKPSILINYRPEHADMEPYIQRKYLRNFVINLHGLWNCFPFDENYLHIIGEINFDDKYGMENGEVIDTEQREFYPLGKSYRKILYKI